MMRASFFILLVFFCVGCGSHDVQTHMAQCEQAAQEVADCLDRLATDENVRCQRYVDLATTQCDGEKSDGLATFLCATGILRYCDVPECVDDSLAWGDCSELIAIEGCGSCDYYLCKEAAEEPRACGPTGYYTAYGFKYCDRLTQVARPSMSLAGQAWVDKTRRCLMEAIETDIGDDYNCTQIQVAALDSHPACYVDSGFCSLSFSDQWTLFLTIDSGDLALQDVLTAGVACFADLFSNPA